MSLETVIVIVVLILLLGGGGGWYYYGRRGQPLQPGESVPGPGPSYWGGPNLIGILVFILVVILVIFLLRQIGVFR